MLSTQKSQLGVTLVELMIASLIGLIAAAALVTAYSATAHHSSQYLRRAQLHQQLYTLMHVMVSGIRRAGYWNFEPGLFQASDNPFQNPANRVRTGTFPGEAADSCILFAYDLNKDGLVGVGSCSAGGCTPGHSNANMERFGFRLRDGRVQSRYGGRATSCYDGYWQAVTDPDTRVSRLAFSVVERCLNLEDPDAPCVADGPRLIRLMASIEMDAHSSAHPQTKLSLSGWVNVRNDRLER